MMPCEDTSLSSLARLHNINIDGYKSYPMARKCSDGRIVI